MSITELRGSIRTILAAGVFSAADDAGYNAVALQGLAGAIAAACRAAGLEAYDVQHLIDDVHSSRLAQPMSVNVLAAIENLRKNPSADSAALFDVLTQCVGIGAVHVASDIRLSTVSSGVPRSSVLIYVAAIRQFLLEAAAPQGASASSSASTAARAEVSRVAAVVLRSALLWPVGAGYKGGARPLGTVKALLGHVRTACMDIPTSESRRDTIISTIRAVAESMAGDRDNPTAALCLPGYATALRAFMDAPLDAIGAGAGASGGSSSSHMAGAGQSTGAGAGAGSVQSTSAAAGGNAGHLVLAGASSSSRSSASFVRSSSVETGVVGGEDHDNDDDKEVDSRGLGPEPHPQHHVGQEETEDEDEEEEEDWGGDKVGHEDEVEEHDAHLPSGASHDQAEGVHDEDEDDDDGGGHEQHGAQGAGAGSRPAAGHSGAGAVIPAQPSTAANPTWRSGRGAVKGELVRGIEARYAARMELAGTGGSRSVAGSARKRKVTPSLFSPPGPKKAKTGPASRKWESDAAMAAIQARKPHPYWHMLVKTGLVRPRDTIKFHTTVKVAGEVHELEADATVQPNGELFDTYTSTSFPDPAKWHEHLRWRLWFDPIPRDVLSHMRVWRKFKIQGHGLDFMGDEDDRSLADMWAARRAAVAASAGSSGR